LALEPRGFTDGATARSSWFYRGHADTLADVQRPDFYARLFDFDGVRRWLQPGDLIGFDLGDCRAEGRIEEVDPVARTVRVFVFRDTVVPKGAGDLPLVAFELSETKRVEPPATKGRAAA
jgi:hypothetical protein